jgi:deoxyribonuclease V
VNLSPNILEILSREQLRLSKNVLVSHNSMCIELVAGVDVAYDHKYAYAASVVIDRDFNIIEKKMAKSLVNFPYIPGYLSYRELMPSKKAVDKLENFDVLFVNGHGIAHPRRFGLASHLGATLNKPTIGVAKRLLVGKVEDEESETPRILLNGRVIGHKIKPSIGAPIYTSVGYRISLETCLRVVEDYTLDMRLPEPLRLAHKNANKFKRSISSHRDQ